MNSDGAPVTGAPESTVAFYRAVLDSLTEHIAIVGGDGAIRYVNRAWERFARENDSAAHNWIGVDYLAVCRAAAEAGEDDGAVAADGLRHVMVGGGEFYHEYPCHSPTEQRWFLMRVTPLGWDGGPSFVVSHQNITERKLAEERVAALSLTDGLTGLANRRHFDEFIDVEWRRAMRERHPVSLVLLDVDHFKAYNDHYGHLAGDRVLERFGAVLRRFGNRPGDLCARYGGEEFALVLGTTERAIALDIATQVRDAVRAEDIAHEGAGTGARVTASLGVAAVVPEPGGTPDALVRAADTALYAAKAAGRDRVAQEGTA